MNIPHKHILFAAGLALLLSLLLAAGPAASAPTGQVDATIQHLIDHVAGSELTFVRNASEYTPGEAAAHMQKKYRHFRDDIESPEDFIELCATRSLMSGKPYLVIDRQGNTQGTGDWLRAELAAYQVHGP
jgi:hypothetical protein